MIKLFRALISAILPVVATDCAGRFVIRIKNACDWGGMLLVMAEEKLASTVMPRSSSPGRIFRPCSSKMSVSWFTTRRTVPDGVPHPAQFVYEIVTKCRVLWKHLQLTRKIPAKCCGPALQVQKDCRYDPCNYLIYVFSLVYADNQKLVRWKLSGKRMEKNEKMNKSANHFGYDCVLIGISS